MTSLKGLAVSINLICSGMCTTMYPNLSDIEVESEVVEVVNEPEEKVYYSIDVSRETQDFVIDFCTLIEIEPSLIFAIAFRESSYRAKVTNGTSIGMCQIQPQWWEDIMTANQIDDLTDEKQNLKCCALIMKYLLEKNYGDVYSALQEYNTGDPNYKNNYAKRVLETKQQLEEEVYGIQ